MKDTNRPVRKAFFQLLNKALTFEGAIVPVSDKQTKSYDDNNFYVILDNQTSTPDDTKTSYDEEVTITLDIVTKTDYSATSDIADNIADQIFSLLFPSSIPHLHNLPNQPGFQFINLRKSSDRYLPLQISQTQFSLRRILQFSLRVVY